MPAGYGWRGAVAFTSLGAVNSRLAQPRWRLNLPARAVIRRNSRLDRLRLRLVLDDDDCLSCGQLTTDQLALAARTLEADACSGGMLRGIYRMQADRRMVRDLEMGGVFIVRLAHRRFVRVGFSHFSPIRPSSALRRCLAQGVDP